MNREKHPYIEQEWSLHAQLTFSHGVEDPPPIQPPSGLSSNRPYHPCYGFQRGNIVFTTRPRSPSHPPSTPTTNYGSLPSSNSRRTPQPYNRRCMSTCNIVLGRSTPSTTPCHHAVTVSSCDMCDVCAGGGRSPTAARRAHTFTSHFCTRVPDKTPATTNLKDAASQTSHSTLCPEKATSTSSSMLQVPQTTTEASTSQGVKHLRRSPAHLRGKSPLMKDKQSPSNEKNQKKQPRTVHIDVYCTASERSSSEDSDMDDESSPQTVFESEKVKVSHRRETERLPQALVRQKRRTLSEGSSLSSLYPSQRSSVSSVVASQGNPSFATTSNSGITSGTSSCALFSDDSAAATSWKDTTTDFESLRQSDISLTKSESFEYADYSDKLRIKEKEKAWGTEDNNSKTWRSPEKERKHHLQQEKYQQYIQRRGSPFPHWKPIDSSEESDGSSETEMAYSFGRLEEISKFENSLLKREDTVRRNNKESKLSDQSKIKCCDSGSFSDSGHVSYSRQRDCIGPFGKKEDSPPKAKFESSITTPFTSVPGIKSEQLSKAEKFGTIISTLKKPGHHVGPSKNPDCLCDNCRQYFEDKWYKNRNRARSLGDMPLTRKDQWKATLQSIVQNKQQETGEESAGDNDLFSV